MKLQIKNGRVIDPANHVDRIADVFVSDGKIAAIGTAPAGFKADRVIEARDKLVLPGLVDLAARLREHGLVFARQHSWEEAALQYDARYSQAASINS